MNTCAILITNKQFYMIYFTFCIMSYIIWHMLTWDYMLEHMVGGLYIKFSVYLAGCRLEINDTADFLNGSSLGSFEGKLPYDRTVKLFITSDILDPHSEENDLMVESGGIRVSRTNDSRWVFSSSDRYNPCHILASADYSQLTGLLGVARDPRKMLDNFMQLLRVAVESHLTYHGYFSLHASCIAIQNKAILFTAPSGIGKSTQARIWSESFGAKILSGDRPLLQYLEEGAWAHGAPWDGKEQIFMQEKYPAATIIEVRRAESNYVRRLSVKQAAVLLSKQSFIPMWDDTAKFLVMETIQRIARKVPFYRLFCLPEEGSAQVVYKALFGYGNSIAREVQSEMKLKDGFILKNIAGEWVVMPAGSKMKEFDGAIVLNEISAFIWKQLENIVSRDDILSAILEEYDIDAQQAGMDLDEFLQKLKALNVLQTEET